jgi:hypothetical protein
MLLSVPLTMVVKIGLESSQSGMWLAILLADNVDEKLSDHSIEDDKQDDTEQMSKQEK